MKIDKNHIIQKISEYFKVGLKSFPLFRFQIDTNRINARGGKVHMNQLEKWEKDGIITILLSDIVSSELKQYSKGFEKTSGQCFTMGFAEDEKNPEFTKIQNILFPNGCKNENQMNEVPVVFHAYKYKFILVTNDGDSKSQPTGILGNALALQTQLNNFKVVRDSDAVNMVQSEIDKLNEYAKVYSQETGTILELFA